MGERYTFTAVGLHWLMAVLLTALFALGLYMTDIALSPWKLKLYAWHRWAGVLALLLVMFRIVWRIAHRPPALPDSMSDFMRWAAHAGHGALYLLMIAVPVSGWLMSSAKGVPTVLFGVLPIPDPLEKNEEVGDALHEAHEWLNYLLAALVVGHSIMAIKHHVVDKNDVLTRMLPRRSA